MIFIVKNEIIEEVKSKEELKRFFEMLYPEQLEEDEYIRLLAMKKGKEEKPKVKYVRSYDEFVRFIASHRYRWDVYCQLATNRGRESGNAESQYRRKVLFLDFDLKDYPEFKDAYDVCSFVKEKLSKLFIQACIFSGHGYHLYVSVDEKSSSFEEIVNTNKDLVSLLGADLGAASVAQISRPPYTYNHKYNGGYDYKNQDNWETVKSVFNDYKGPAYHPLGIPYINRLMKDYNEKLENEMILEEISRNSTITEDNRCYYCIQKVIEEGAEVSERNTWHGRIVKYLQLIGKGPSEIHSTCQQWNKKCRPPKSEIEIKEDTEAYMSKDYNLLGCYESIPDERKSKIVEKQCDKYHCKTHQNGISKKNSSPEVAIPISLLSNRNLRKKELRNAFLVMTMLRKSISHPTCLCGSSIGMYRNIALKHGRLFCEGYTGSQNITQTERLQKGGKTMNRPDKEVLEQRTRNQYQSLRMKIGIHNVIHQKKAAIAAAGYIILAVVGWMFLQKYPLENRYEFLEELYRVSFRIAYMIAVFVGASMLLMFLGTPAGARNIHENLWRIGLMNHAGETPLLIRNYTEKNAVVMEFEPCGVPLKEWQDKKERIETALNIHILKITHGKNRKRILLHAVSGERDLPDILYWKDTEMSKIDFELVLGQSFGGKVKVNLTKVPHILLGGSTGSGKSVLLKLLLMQCVKKGAEIYIADFKGGVDFSLAWHQNCKIITEETELLDVLTMIVEELENRKVLFRECGCANLTEYQKQCRDDVKRYIFACDEVAEVLDKTGLSKEQKELVTKIESKLSVIARQGRAFGIHLILATQRPDANILSGQIRNNIDYRVCGRADNVLSQIILDNTDAADKIPKDAQGLFVNHEGTVFRAYLFDEEWK